MSQSAAQKPCIKPHTASNAGVEAQWLGKTPLKGQNQGRNLEEPGYERWPVLFWLCWVEIITEHGHKVATGQHLRS
jgi:hypothetical protein